ncbi:DUF432 domain-containing protein [Draconibacterium halophilum]|uniref:DUF432 domain-containing protein n=1 Tax=Draconibacterium halophilum TaxID=2706887 RepID=A0A6C0RBF4_9BACT|nr:DUF432 domain-containing protein [Draconibacterium halophilum]QIA07978.1 DUF432 domain-containing protein [Draconibacterium halophilum]
MEKVSIYGTKQINPGESVLKNCDHFTLGIKRNDEGWHLKSFDNKKEDKDPDTEEINDGTYYHSGKSNKLILSPALPVKPMVFKGSRMVISPNQRLTFFVKIPLILQVYASKKQDETLLAEFPLQQISNTWFGEPIQGEAAFALESEHFLDITALENDEKFAVCPITIFNNDNAPLQIERLIIRVDHMHLLKFKEHFVTSQVKLEYRGKDYLSSASYGFAKAFHGENHEIIAKPRNPEGKSMLKINFHFIKNIYRTE